jgi:hypothetical protein
LGLPFASAQSMSLGETVLRVSSNGPKSRMKVPQGWQQLLFLTASNGF